MKKKEIEEFVKRIQECNLSQSDKLILTETVTNRTLSKSEVLFIVGEVFGLSSEILEFISQFLE